MNSKKSMERENRKMKSMKTKLITTVMLAFSWVGAVNAGERNVGEVGNGGGAWVCREANGDIRSAMLVDLFEADAQFGLKIAQYPGSAHDVLDQVILRIFRLDSNFAEKIQEKLDAIHYLEPGQKVMYTEDDLTLINDALYKIQPGQKRCVGGTIAYSQAVNFDDSDDSIWVQSGIFKSLDATHEAALMMHEAIYAYLRKEMGDKNSIRARRVVGLLFSTISQEELKKQLETVFGSGTNAAGMRFVRIRAGSFMMGSPDNESNRDSAEKQHLVQLTQDFEIQTTEVTQKQYFDVMGVNPSNFKNIQNCPKSYQATPNGFVGCPNNPVEWVSYNDAQAFIARLNQARKDGYFYRLPTEAEWEFAARSGTSTAYSFGNDPSQLAPHGWFSGNSGLQTHEVAQLKPNALGLYDMHGNVWELNSDFYGDYSSVGQINPVGPLSGSLRVVRGSSWYNSAQNLRSASRYYVNPDARYPDLGVRLVRTR